MLKYNFQKIVSKQNTRWHTYKYKITHTDSRPKPWTEREKSWGVYLRVWHAEENSPPDSHDAHSPPIMALGCRQLSTQPHGHFLTCPRTSGLHLSGPRSLLCALPTWQPWLPGVVGSLFLLSSVPYSVGHWNLWVFSHTPLRGEAEPDGASMSFPQVYWPQRYTPDVELLPKAALWESSNRVTLLWDHQTFGGYYYLLPRSGPGNKTGSGSESSLPSTTTTCTVNSNSYFLSLLNNPFPQPRAPLFSGDGGGMGTSLSDYLKLLKIPESKSLKLKAQNLLSLFFSSLLTLLSSLRDNARLWSQSNWQDIAVERGGEPQLILHVLPLHSFYMTYALGVICNIPVFIRPVWPRVWLQLALSHLPAVGLWAQAQLSTLRLALEAVGTGHKPLAWGKLPGSHWESQKPRPYCPAGEQGQGVGAREAGLPGPVHIRAEILPGSTVWLLAKPLPGSLNTVVTKGLCFFWDVDFENDLLRSGT